ncbi:MAG TPA: glycosyltransferase family 2 protein [Planctomycetota bacterium]|nr:glycosyltransferase family 2 protein [Planctomycetota bacterium]
MRVSIVVPAHDEQDNLRPLRTAIKEALDGHLDYEVIIVDDASRDATRSVAREIASEDPRFRLVALARNSGETAAGWAGMKEARGDLICVMDADLQNDPRDLPRMLERIGEFDVVCGWRRRRGDGDGLVRRVSSRVANAVRNALSNEAIHDSGCTYRVFRRECIEGLQLFAGMHRFLPTLFKAQGWKVTEVEVANRPRHSGRSKYGVWNRAFRAFHDLLAVRWMLSRWIRLEVADRAGQGLLDEAAAGTSRDPR